MIHCINSKTLHRDAMGIIVEHSVNDEYDLYDLSKEDAYVLYDKQVCIRHIAMVDDTSQYILTETIPTSQEIAHQSWKLPGDEG